MLTDDPLLGLLAIENGYETARWNFFEAVGSQMEIPGGIGSGVSLSYSFLSSVPDYYVDWSGDKSSFEPLSEAQQEAVRSVLGHISSVADITWEEVEGVGQLTFGAISQSSAAYAYYPNFSYSYLVEDDVATIESVSEESIGGDVWLGSSDIWSEGDFLPGGVGYETLIHEISHALGLQHPFEEDYQLISSLNHSGYTAMAYEVMPDGKVMEFKQDPDSSSYLINTYDASVRTLMLGDTTALQYLYGKNSLTASEDNRYFWEPGELFFETIWDAGGIDTIDCSNQPFGCVIDLNGGSYSSIGLRTTEQELRDGLSIPDWYQDTLPESLYSGSNNLAIAYDVVLENVVATSLNDYIVGNEVDNWIDAGLGSDVIEGGGGVDTLYYEGWLVDYSVEKSDQGWLISKAGEIDQISEIEWLQFGDHSVELSQFALHTVAGVLSFWGRDALSLEGKEISLQIDGQRSIMLTATDEVGAFLFSDVLPGQYHLAIAEEIDGTGAITVEDALNTLKLSASNDVIAVSVEDKSLAEHAADIDQDERVTSLDALMILKMALGVTQNSSQLRVVKNSSTSSEGGTVLSPTVLAEESDQVQLTGILLGDVDGSWML